MIRLEESDDLGLAWLLGLIDLLSNVLRQCLSDEECVQNQNAHSCSVWD